MWVATNIHNLSVDVLEVMNSLPNFIILIFDGRWCNDAVVRRECLPSSSSAGDTTPKLVLQLFLGVLMWIITVVYTNTSSNFLSALVALIFRWFFFFWKS